METDEINIFEVTRLVGLTGRQQTFTQMEASGLQQTGKERGPRSMHSGYDDWSTHAASLLSEDPASSGSCDILEK